MYKEIKLLKSTGTTQSIKLTCVICKDENGKNKTKIYDNINTLDKHIKATHSTHPSYRAVKLLVKNVKIALNLGMVR